MGVQPTAQPAPVEYQYGSVGANQCPDGYSKITQQSRCKEAARSLGGNLRFRRKASWNFLPGGCFRYRKDSVLFNTHHGTGEANSEPICEIPDGPTVQPTAQPAPVEYQYGSLDQNLCPDSSYKVTQQSRCEEAAQS